MVFSGQVRHTLDSKKLFVQEIHTIKSKYARPMYYETHVLGCNNRGGCGNISNVMRLVAKWTGTRKRLFYIFARVGF